MVYGISSDLVYDHLVMGDSQDIKCVKRFVIAVVQVFVSKYLRAPGFYWYTQIN
jgi:hypothetical protein